MATVLSKVMRSHLREVTNVDYEQERGMTDTQADAILVEAILFLGKKQKRILDKLDEISKMQRQHEERMKTPRLESRR